MVALDFQYQDTEARHEDHEVSFPLNLADMLGDVKGMKDSPFASSSRFAQSLKDENLAWARLRRVVGGYQVSHSSRTSIGTRSESLAQSTVDGANASILNAVTDPPRSKANTCRPEASNSSSALVLAISLRR